MHPGDFILTPSWTYHDHGNPGDEPMVWLDGLDMPIVNLFDTSFAEHYPGEVQPNTIPDGDSLARYGAQHAAGGLLAGAALVADLQLSVLAQPRDARAAASGRTAARVPRHQDALREPGDRRLPDADDRRVHAAAARRIPRHAVSADRRDDLRRRRGPRPHARRRHDATSGGRATSSSCRRGRRSSHEAQEEAVLFSLSDRPAQKALGLWREQALVTSCAGPLGRSRVMTRLMTYRIGQIVPELQHHDGDGDPGDAARARGGRARALHLPLEPHADEEGDEGGAGGDGRRLGSLRRGARRRARGRARLRLPRGDHEHGQGLSLPVAAAAAGGHRARGRAGAGGDERGRAGRRPADAQGEEDRDGRAVRAVAVHDGGRLHRARGHRGRRSRSRSRFPTTSRSAAAIRWRSSTSTSG